MSCWTYFVSSCQRSGGCVSTTFGEKVPEPCESMVKKVSAVRSGTRCLKQVGVWKGELADFEKKEFKQFLEIGSGEYLCLMNCFLNSTREEPASQTDLHCRKFCLPG